MNVYSFTSAAQLASNVNTSFPVIVVGSGLTGSFAAKELSEAGANVLLIERGTFPTAHEPIVGGDDNQQIQQHCSAFGLSTRHLFVDDAVHPYECPSDAPFFWIRGHHVGGRSLLWSGHSYRLGPQDFETISPHFGNKAWPITYDDLSPWYSRVEKFMGISGDKDNIPQVPDGEFLPSLPLNTGEQEFLHRLKRIADTPYQPIAARMAILTRDRGERRACRYNGPCFRGCDTGALYTALNSALPAALATGRLTLLLNTIVSRVIFDPRSHQATGVEVVDITSNKRFELSAQVIFLCASTLASTQILLQSRSSTFPNGLGNNFDVLGRFLMDHLFQVGAQGSIHASPTPYTPGYRPGGIYIPSTCKTKELSAAWSPRFGFQVAAVPDSRQMSHEATNINWWRLWVGGWGECEPSPDNRVMLHSERVDRWLLPILSIRFKSSVRDLQCRNHIREAATSILRDVGCVDIEPFDHGPNPGLCVHEMGTARMGLDPTLSVLNEKNQIHGCANVFVTDGSCMPASPPQNPSLTYLALTCRACAAAMTLLN